MCMIINNNTYMSTIIYGKIRRGGNLNFFFFKPLYLLRKLSLTKEIFWSLKIRYRVFTVY